MTEDAKCLRCSSEIRETDTCCPECGWSWIEENLVKESKGTGVFSKALSSSKLTLTEIARARKVQLQAWCRDLNLNSDGTVLNLRKRLRCHLDPDNGRKLKDKVFPVKGKKVSPQVALDVLEAGPSHSTGRELSTGSVSNAQETKSVNSASSQSILEKSREALETSSVKSICFLLTIHIIIMLISYRELGFPTMLAAGGLFSVIYPITAFLISLAIALLIIFIFGSVIFAAFKSDSLIEVGQIILVGLVVLFVVGIVIVLAPPLLAGAAIATITDSVLLGIIVGVVVAAIWFVILKYGPAVIYAVIVGQITHAVTISLITGRSAAHYLDRLSVPLERISSRTSFEEAIDILGYIIQTIDIPPLLVLWCAVMGIIYVNVAEKNDK